jgi:hypothetical protein
MANTKRYGKYIFWLFIASTFLCIQSVQASLLIDQHNDSVPPFQGFTTPQAIGQSFIPDVGLLAAVELQINDQSIGDGNGFGAFINIRSNNITGSLLGTSNTLNFADTPSGPISPIFSALFDFTLPLILTPGNNYVIEVLPAGTNVGNIGVFVTGFNFDGYAKGTAIADTMPTLPPDAGPTDLWFRTYYPAPVPEPGSYLLIGLGFALMGWIARKSKWL